MSSPSDEDDGTLTDPPPYVNPLDELVFESSFEPGFDPAVLQVLLEQPDHIFMEGGTTEVASPGVTEPGVEKVWNTHHTEEDEEGNARLVGDVQAIVPNELPPS